jgi:hypothetical protein
VLTSLKTAGFGAGSGQTRGGRRRRARAESARGPRVPGPVHRADALDARAGADPDAARQWGRGLGRARSHRRFVLPFIHFIPGLLTYSVPLFLKRRCDRTLGLRCQVRRAHRGDVDGPGPPGAPATPQSVLFSTVNLLCVAILYGYAGRLTAKTARAAASTAARASGVEARHDTRGALVSLSPRALQSFARTPVCFVWVIASGMHRGT